MYRIELYLNSYDTIRLDEFRFYYSEDSPPLITSCSGSPSYCVGASKNFFLWSAGVRALTLLLLKAADPKVDRASIVGEARTPASSLDYALSKEPGWLIDFFGTTSSGAAIAKLLFGRRNSERKRPGPVEVYINDGLIKRENVSVFLNGNATNPEIVHRLHLQLDTAISKGEPQTQLAGSSSLVGNCPVDERESSPFAVIWRKLRRFVDVREGQSTYSFTSTYLNITPEPISFLQSSIFNPEQCPISNISVSCRDCDDLNWDVVFENQHEKRLLVTFSNPILPGERRTVTFSHQTTETLDCDSWMSHTLRFPCEELHLEFECSRTHGIGKSTIVAERDGKYLYGRLPNPQVHSDKNGHSCICWSMKNPPQGFQYRLHWALEEKAAKRLDKSRVVTALQAPDDLALTRGKGKKGQMSRIVEAKATDA